MIIFVVIIIMNKNPYKNMERRWVQLLIKDGHGSSSQGNIWQDTTSSEIIGANTCNQEFV